MKTKLTVKKTISIVEKIANIIAILTSYFNGRNLISHPLTHQEFFPHKLAPRKYTTARYIQDGTHQSFALLRARLFSVGFRRSVPRARRRYRSVRRGRHVYTDDCGL